MLTALQVEYLSGSRTQGKHQCCLLRGLLEVCFPAFRNLWQCFPAYQCGRKDKRSGSKVHQTCAHGQSVVRAASGFLRCKWRTCHIGAALPKLCREGIEVDGQNCETCVKDDRSAVPFDIPAVRLSKCCEPSMQLCCFSEQHAVFLTYRFCSEAAPSSAMRACPWFKG